MKYEVVSNDCPDDKLTIYPNEQSENIYIEITTGSGDSEMINLSVEQCVILANYLYALIRKGNNESVVILLKPPNSIRKS